VVQDQKFKSSGIIVEISVLGPLMGLIDMPPMDTNRMKSKVRTTLPEVGLRIGAN